MRSRVLYWSHFLRKTGVHFSGKCSNRTARLIGMAQSYDLVLRGATVVNHDGEGVRDLAVAGSRIAAIGDLRHSPAAEVIDGA
jgi:hypothetical protein